MQGIHWLGHDTFRFDGPPVVYVDPYRLAGRPEPAGLVLVTHEHSDHCSPDDVARIRTPQTVVVAPAAAAAKLPPPVEVVAPGDEGSWAGVRVHAVPAYNTDKAFHPRAAGHVGYVVTIAGITVYHAGDTDVIPEMADLAPDVALLPVSGTYVMTAEQAAEAARAIRPGAVVPMHYGTVVGTEADALRFAGLLEGSGIQVEVLPRE